MLSTDIDDFIASLRFERSMAENTCAAYGRDLRFFAEFLGKRGVSESADVTRAEIDAYLGEERDDGKKSTTRARRMAAIRMWLKFLKERRYIRKNPAELIDAPKKAKALPKVLSEEETFRMLDAVSGKDPRELRDRAMLEVMYGCGLRVSELCALSTDDIIADGELLRVLGKGSRSGWCRSERPRGVRSRTISRPPATSSRRAIRPSLPCSSRGSRSRLRDRRSSR